MQIAAPPPTTASTTSATRCVNENCCALFGAYTKWLHHCAPSLLTLTFSLRVMLVNIDCHIGGKQPTRRRGRKAHITLLQLKSKLRTLWRRQGKLNSSESQGKQINVAFFAIKIKKGSAVRVATQIEFRVNSVCALMSNLLQWNFINGWRGRGVIFDGSCSNIFANASHCLIEFTACKWRRNWALCLMNSIFAFIHFACFLCGNANESTAKGISVDFTELFSYFQPCRTEVKWLKREHNVITYSIMLKQC